ncbi:GPW/gp25 family protein [Archangium violaceum]|uniref:GPW/gp25 family protein n=1 Tax=Archangium violaceum TaxID=83451 RepID=UPI00193C6601|nr:GPW/gp25 family protein [Archangium violaceum]QRK06976.1 GPW/gp25 family protein [Archangium violaceum]
MARQAFLDKFGNNRRDGTRDELVQVLRNLEAVLNTQQGYGFFRRDFGLGEYMEKRGTRALVQTLTSEIQSEIETNEPRLKDVEVTLEGRDATLWLHFKLTATLGGQPVELRLFFDTVSSRVRVQKKEE